MVPKAWSGQHQQRCPRPPESEILGWGQHFLSSQSPADSLDAHASLRTTCTGSWWGGEVVQFRNKCLSKWEVAWQLPVQEPQDLPNATMRRRHLWIKKPLPQLMAPCTNSALIRKWPHSTGKTFLWLPGPESYPCHNLNQKNVWPPGLPLPCLNSGPNLSSSRTYVIGET